MFLGVPCTSLVPKSEKSLVRMLLLDICTTRINSQNLSSIHLIRVQRPAPGLYSTVQNSGEMKHYQRPLIQYRCRLYSNEDYFRLIHFTYFNVIHQHTSYNTTMCEFCLFKKIYIYILFQLLFNYVLKIVCFL